MLGQTYLFALFSCSSFRGNSLGKQVDLPNEFALYTPNLSINSLGISALRLFL